MWSWPLISLGAIRRQSLSTEDKLSWSLDLNSSSLEVISKKNVANLKVLAGLVVEIVVHY